MKPCSTRLLTFFSVLPAVLPGLLLACGSADVTVTDGAVVVMDLAQARPDLARKLDMTNLGTDPVGSPCEDESMCSGNRPTCLKDIMGFNIMLPAPLGYCSDKSCKSDDDCGGKGYCFDGVNICLGTCAGPGDCAMINPGNVCINVMGGQPTCFPNPVPNSCNPTVEGSCMDGGACLRVALAAIDDFGSCVAQCQIRQPCPDAGGMPQACYFVNSRIDNMGKATRDAFAGLICLPDLAKGGGGPDAACTTLNGCQAGYECNLFMAGGIGKVCRKLCRNGGNDCVIGTCQNAYKLAKFEMDDIGLCL